MLNNWMFGSEPVKIYSPLLSLDPLACQDGIRSQACGLMFARHSIPSAQEWPVSFPERAVFASGLQYLLDCYLWWLKVQIGLVDKVSPPTYSVHLRCTLALRLWVSFYLLMCWRSYTLTFFFHMVYKTKCQTLYFFFYYYFFLISLALLSSTENGRSIEGKNTFTVPPLQSPCQGQ